MTAMYRTTGTLILLLCLGGCVSLTPQQCATADWHALGRSDSARGLYPQVERHTRACARAGLPSNPHLYAQGYTSGLALYCRPQTVMGDALRGAGNLAICPAEHRPELLPYYRAGRNVYDAETTLTTLTAEQRRLGAELERGGWTDARHLFLRQRLYALQGEIESATRARWEAEHLLVRYQALLP